MKNVAIALYAEGNTDDLFLPSVIQRTSRRILVQYGQGSINVPEVEQIELSERKSSRADCIFQAAKQATPYHILIVHSDADAPTRDNALQWRILPGFMLVQQTPGPRCKKLLPIIPIQAIEAWILADHETLRKNLGTDLSAHKLGIPVKTNQIESISDPKQRLKLAKQKVDISRPRRRRGGDMGLLYQPMGESISLERLEQLPSYQQFVKDLTATFKQLDLIK